MAALLLCVLVGLWPGAGAAQTRKTVAMREKVYAKLSKAQEATEAQDWKAAFDNLADVERMKDLSPNEKAQLFTAYGYTYFAQEKYAESAASYEKVLEQEELPEAMRLSTIYTLGQLHFHLEHYQQAADYLQDWLKLASNPGPEPYILLGQAYYQLGKLEQAAGPVQQAIDIARERGARVQENWYALLRVIYFETKNYPRLLEVLEILVRDYPAKEYWLHLSSAYGEMGDTARQLAAYDMAYQQGFLKRGNEIVLLAQLLLQAEVPYRAGTLLQQGLDDGTIEGTAANWRLLSQAWIMAQEHQKAIAQPEEGGRAFRRRGTARAHRPVLRQPGRLAGIGRRGPGGPGPGCGQARRAASHAGHGLLRAGSLRRGQEGFRQGPEQRGIPRSGRALAGLRRARAGSFAPAGHQPLTLSPSQEGSS